MLNLFLVIFIAAVRTPDFLFPFGGLNLRIYFGIEMQRAKKVVSVSPGLVDFAIGLVKLLTCLTGK